MAKTLDKRQANRARRALRSELRWLQKALFALSKAEDARESVEKITGETGSEVKVALGGDEHDLDTVTAALRDMIERRMQEQREELRDRMRPF